MKSSNSLEIILNIISMIQESGSDPFIVCLGNPDKDVIQAIEDTIVKTYSKPALTRIRPKVIRPGVNVKLPAIIINIKPRSIPERTTGIVLSGPNLTSDRIELLKQLRHNQVSVAIEFTDENSHSPSYQSPSSVDKFDFVLNYSKNI